MLHKTFTLLIFITFGLLHLQAQVELKVYGDIPADRIAANGWAHFEWDSTGTWTTIDVSKHGIVPNTSADIAPKVSALINAGSGKRILKFPAGTYQVKSGMNISKGDIQIVGEGSSTKFMLAGGANPGRIYANGSRSGSYKLATDVARGENKATLTSASAFNVGDYFIIKQPGSATRPGASGDETQIFRILAKSGNTLSLDMKFGIPFYKAHATIEKLGYKKNLRFHNFYMEMTNKPDNKTTNLSLNTVQNVEVSKVESKNALIGHITIFRGRECILHNNNVYGNYGGGGGYQYGYTFNFSTNCHMINNRSADLRHHYVTQYGTDHCVIAYNRAEPGYNGYADYGQHNSKGCHNNLWEGNYGSELYSDRNQLKSWGTRYTMWFRNHATRKVGSENAYVEHINIIGNELTGGTSAIKTGEPGEDIFVGANIVNIDGEGGQGIIVWGDMKQGDQIPASLFLAERPSYVSRWPLYGPEATFHPKSKLQIKLIRPDTNLIELHPGYPLVIEAEVSDEALLDSLSLFMNGTFIRSIKSGPFIWDESQYPTTDTINNLSQGLHSFKLEAFDTTGAVSKTVLQVEVREAHQPYVGVIQIPGTIEAENYDTGGEGIAYHDADNTNDFGMYRYDGVDIDLLEGQRYYVSNIFQREWLAYTVDVLEDGFYNFEFIYASGRGGGEIGAQCSGADTVLFKDLRVPSTKRGWTDFQTLTKENIWLPKGQRVLRINFENIGYNLDKIIIRKHGATYLKKRAVQPYALIYPNPNTTGVFHLSSVQAWTVYTLNGTIFKRGRGKLIQIEGPTPSCYIVKTENTYQKIVIQ